ncbi:MAG: hypothetical protein WC523_02365 [Patescibacteria group bacterium]|jgi:hypothetical protein
MLTGSLLLILLIVVVFFLGLGLGYIVGFFNKKVAEQMKIIVYFVRHLEINWKNFRRLFRQIKGLIKILPKKRTLFWRLFARTRQEPN